MHMDLHPGTTDNISHVTLSKPLAFGALVAINEEWDSLFPTVGWKYCLSYPVYSGLVFSE